MTGPSYRVLKTAERLRDSVTDEWQGTTELWHQSGETLGVFRFAIKLAAERGWVERRDPVKGNRKAYYRRPQAPAGGTVTVWRKYSLDVQEKGLIRGSIVHTQADLVREVLAATARGATVTVREVWLEDQGAGPCEGEGREVARAAEQQKSKEGQDDD